MIGNVSLRPWWASVWLALLAACAGTPGIAPDVIVPDAHHSQGHVLAFADADAALASGGSDGFVRLWRLPDGAPLAGFRAHDDSVYGLAFVARDRQLLSAGYDGRLALWSRDGRPVRERRTPSPVTAMAVHEAGNLVLTGHADGRVRRWQLPDLAPVAEWALHRDDVRAVAVHAASGTFASSGTDGQVYLWGAAQTPRALPAPPTDARDLAFTPDGRRLLGGGWFKLFRWDLGAGTLAVLPTEHRGIVTALDVGPGGRTLASISRQTDSAVLFLDPETGATRRRFQKHDLCGENVVLSRDGRWLASTADDGSMYLWNLSNNAK